MVSLQTGAETPAPETAPEVGAEVEVGDGVGVIVSAEKFKERSKEVV